MLRTSISLLIGLGLAACIESPSFAADLSQAPDQAYAPQAPQGWIVTLSATGVVGPSYLGAKNYSFVAYPSIGFRRAGAPQDFAAPDDGIGFNLSPLSWLRFGPVARYQGGRYGSGNPQLYGLRKVKWTLQGGGFVEVWPTEHVRGRVEVVHGFRDADGFAAYLSADWVERLGRWTLSGGPRMTIQDAKDMRNHFGISLAEAIANQTVQPYRPKAGIGPSL